MPHLEIIDILGRYRDRAAELFASAPADLRDTYVPTLGPGAVSPSEVRELEISLPVPLPSSFREYLVGPALAQGPEWSDIRVPGNTHIEDVEPYLLAHELWPIKLLQFASGPCGDPVCFDFAYPPTAGELPVVIINHDWTQPSDWKDQLRIRKFVSARWPGFREFLKDMCEGNNIEFRDLSSPAV